MKRSIVLALSLAAATAAFAVSEVEPDNNSSGGAVFFTVPDSLTGSLQSDGGSFPVDYFRFTATGGVTYRFISSGSNLDPDIDIENSSLNIVSSNTGPAHENFAYTPPSSGTYYVVVYGAAQPFAGPYTVSVSVESSVNDWDLY